MYELTIKCATLDELKTVAVRLDGLDFLKAAAENIQSAVVTAHAADPVMVPAKQPRTRKNKGDQPPQPQPEVGNNTGNASPVLAPASENSSQGDGVVSLPATPSSGGQATQPAATGAAAGGDLVNEETVKKAMEDLNTRKGLVVVRDLLAKFGASRRSEIPTEKYAAFVAEANAL